jgi:hypothetical protein
VAPTVLASSSRAPVISRRGAGGAIGAWSRPPRRGAAVTAPATRATASSRGLGGDRELEILDDPARVCEEAVLARGLLGHEDGLDLGNCCSIPLSYGGIRVYATCELDFSTLC